MDGQARFRGRPRFVALAVCALLAIAGTALIVSRADPTSARSGGSLPAKSAAQPEGSKDREADGTGASIESHGFREQAKSDGPADGTRAPDGDLLIRVETASGALLPETEVIVFDGESILGAGRLDADRSFRASVGPRACEVLVLASGRAPHLARIAASERPATVVLPIGARVAGIVEVNGAPPPESLKLALYTPELRHTVVPASVAARIETWWTDGRHRHQETTTEGAFAFEGLRADWSGWIGLPKNYRSVDGEPAIPSIAVSEPRSDLVLRLVRLATLSGTVVEDASGAPVAGARIGVDFPELGTHSLGTDRSGKFSLLAPFGARSATVRAQAASGAKAETELPGPFEEDRDLGLIRIRQATVSLRVVDTSGSPIAGAVACGRSGDSRSPPTGESGLTEIAVPAEPSTLTVGAAGHEFTTLEVSPSMEQPVVVTLRGGATLKIAIACEEPAHGLKSIALEATQPFFQYAAIQARTHLAESIGGTKPGTMGTGSRWCSAVFELPSGGGPVVVPAVLPHVAIKVRAKDLTDAAVAEQEVSLEPGETKEVVLAVRTKPASVGGIVVDPEGRPVASGAVLVTSTDFQSSMGTPVGADGRFRMEGIHASSVSLQTHVDGFAPRVLRSVALPATELRLELERPRTVRVTVVDEAGEPVPDPRVRCEGPTIGRFEVAEKQDGSVLEFRNLPSGDVTLIATVGSDSYELRHDTAKPEARIVVPLQGALDVRWTVLPRPDSSYLVSVSRDGVPGHAYSWLDKKALATGGVARFAALKPGRYIITLLGTIPDPDDGLRRETVATTEATVEAGATATCTLAEVR